MDPAVLRDDMVDGLEHTLGRPLPEELGLAMRTVPRREFVDDAPYDNRPSTVDGAVTLAPGTVARLLTALDPRADDDALVVGAGAGYTAAVLAEMLGDRHVHALDIARPQVYRARSNLEAAGYGGVLVDCREGSAGLPEYAPTTGFWSKPRPSNRRGGCSGSWPTAVGWCSRRGTPTRRWSPSRGTTTPRTATDASTSAGRCGSRRC
ncbi:protein-L-isoaspartate O-methyltransferase [Halolamina pelagica]|uniref:protein-L-isoaspartate(D-aspartate) O-methyltransferase n=1 Tax=Halolamina pelagica TaxID=699431 RepID=A0A0P7I0V8_9EURY|nr:protein-L-isoaspartate O-methyltransferase [Halolamina pelagica]